MNLEQEIREIRDQLEIADALYRFGAGIDFNSEELLVSSLAPDAIVDFTQSNQLCSQEFPILTGRNTIVQVLKNSVCLLVTTHAVTNPRTQVNGDTAKLYALVEAQHLLPKDRSRYCLMKNQYDVSLVRDSKRWIIKHLIVNGVWFTGKPSILVGK